MREAGVEETAMGTPLREARGYRLGDDFVAVPVLRAGLPIAEGFNAMINKVEIAFVSCWRGKDLHVKVEYAKVPAIQDKNVIIIDPMIATGHSLCAVCETLKGYGTPKNWDVLGVIASPAGVLEMSRSFPKWMRVYVAAFDDEIME